MAEGLQKLVEVHVFHSCFHFLAVQLREVLHCPNVPFGGCPALVLWYQVLCMLAIAGNYPGSSFTLFFLICPLITGESNSFHKSSQNNLKKTP